MSIVTSDVRRPRQRNARLFEFFVNSQPMACLMNWRAFDFVFFSFSFPLSLTRWRANENNYVTRPNQWPQSRRPAGRSFVRSVGCRDAALCGGVSVGRKRDPAERAVSGAEPARTRSHHLGYRVDPSSPSRQTITQLVDRPVPIPSYMQTFLTFASRFKKKKKLMFY